MTACTLYFIENPTLGLIKIGITKRKVEQRRREMEVASGFPLRTLAVIPDGAMHEKGLHSAFAEFRVAGEWFHRTPELLEIIAHPERIPNLIASSRPKVASPPKGTKRTRAATTGSALPTWECR